MSISRILVLAALALAVPACASKEEKLVELKEKQRRDLDALYAAYGGGRLAAEVKTEAERAAAETEASKEEGKAIGRALLSAVANAAGEVDRVAFEEQCLDFGRGERPVVLNDKAKAFFEKPATRDACKEAALRRIEIERLEAEIAPAPAER